MVLGEVKYEEDERQLRAVLVRLVQSVQVVCSAKLPELVSVLPVQREPCWPATVRDVPRVEGVVEHCSPRQCCVQLADE
jgi:hypothetical protein